jgi:hypothetical protein
MYRYTVSHFDAGSRLVALRDPAGQTHIALCISDLPKVGDELGSNLPGGGFAILVSTSGKGFRLIFRPIDRWQ